MCSFVNTSTLQHRQNTDFSAEKSSINTTYIELEHAEDIIFYKKNENILSKNCIFLQKC